MNAKYLLIGAIVCAAIAGVAWIYLAFTPTRPTTDTNLLIAVTAVLAIVLGAASAVTALITRNR